MPSHRYGIGLAHSTRSRRFQRRWAAVCLAAGTVACGHSAFAGTDNWIGGSSNWNNNANWDSAIVPASGDTVIIDTGDAFVDFIEYDYPAPNVTLGSLTINNSGGGNDVFTMQTAGLVLSSGPEIIGGTGSANVNQLDGLNSTTSLLITGNAAYLLDQTGTLFCSGTETIDYGATFNQNGGANSVLSSLVIASQADSTAGYALSGGTLSVGFGDYIGYAGTATFNQTGGAATFKNLDLGFLSSADGNYLLSPGGTLTISLSALIGYDGTGNFTQTGGRAAIGTSLYLAVNTGSSGMYTLTDGTLTSQTEYIANSGSASFAQSGGMHSVSDSIYIGNLAGSNGAYTLDEPGTLAVQGSEYVGYGNDAAAVGSFTQFAGLNTLTGTFSTLAIASGAGSNGSYSLADGTLALTGSGSLEQIGLYGTGTFTQTGGMNMVAGVGENIGLYNGGVGTYNQSGGVNLMTSNFSNLSIGYSAGAVGTYNLTGGSLLAANIYVGGSPGQAGGIGSLNISGNSSVTASGSIVLYNTASSIQLNGGSLVVGNANLNGPYTQTAGAAAFGQITGAGQITLSGGTITLAKNGGLSTAHNITINGGTLDITNNSLEIDYTPGNDPVATVLTYLQSGFNGGAWTGSGITSSAAAANPSHFSVGYLDSTDPGGVPNAVLVKYTLVGDTNLDGFVNFQDLVTVIQNLNKPGMDWAEGNFFYDPNGVVNFQDLVAVVQNFNRSLNSGGGGSGFSGSIQIGDTAVQLPEPTGAALAFAATALLARRRRRKDS
jgi:hypothetical protein